MRKTLGLLMGSFMLCSTSMAANQDFNLKLFKQVVQEKGAKAHSENIMISPTSAKMALGMLLLAATDDSQTQAYLASTLSGENMSYANAKDQLEDLLQKLGTGGYASRDCNLQGENSANVSAAENSQPVVIKMANAYYARSIKEPEQSFLDTLSNPAWSAKIGEFAENNVEDINTWVANQTNCKITDLVKEDDLNADTISMLINAVYFKGKWQYEFKGETETAAKFQLSGNSDNLATAQFMHLAAKKKNQHGHMQRGKVEQLYTNDRVNQVEALKLPFKKVGDKTVASMYFVLPQHGVSVSDIAINKASKVQFWNSLEQNLTQTKLSDVSIPKFKFKSEANLQAALTKIAVTDSDEEALQKKQFLELFESPQIGKMTKDPQAFIKKVQQNAFIAVDEKGAEAAAATLVLTQSRSANRSFSFVANRPFIVAIRHHESGEFLFMGIINKPEFEND